LPNFLTDKKIIEYKQILGNIILQVFMGLQSSNDYVRHDAINSTCSKISFERVSKKLLEVGFQPAAFLIIKAPFLTESEGIDDVLNSLKYLDSIGVKNSTLCPMRISKNTFLSKIYEYGYYKPLWIWSVIDILIKYYEAGGIGTPMVNTTELKQEVNSDSICAISCDKCSDNIISTLEKYLYERDITLLRSLKCDCYKVYNEQKELESHGVIYSIPERIKNFVNELENQKG
jgi:hypothetical protein